jgi:chemotaxis protein MotB
VAYADFVTAMMALFIVLWIVGQSKAVKEAVAAYFTDPAAFSQGSKGVLKHGGASMAPAGPAKPTLPPPDSPPNDRAILEATRRALLEEVHRRAHLMELEKHLKIEMTGEGLRIELVETPEGVFFDVGSARVKPRTRELLTIMARELGKLPNSIMLEGHTDARPYVGGPDYSNWELAVNRANAARRILDIQGLRPDQVARVVGYADRRLANPADPLDAANRRVSITVLFSAEPARTTDGRQPAGRDINGANAGTAHGG